MQFQKKKCSKCLLIAVHVCRKLNKDNEKSDYALNKDIRQHLGAFSNPANSNKRLTNILHYSREL